MHVIIFAIHICRLINDLPAQHFVSTSKKIGRGMRNNNYNGGEENT
jgi:hypothetical protein